MRFIGMITMAAVMLTTSARSEAQPTDRAVRAGHQPGADRAEETTARQLADMLSGLWDYSEKVIPALPS